MALSSTFSHICLWTVLALPTCVQAEETFDQLAKKTDTTSGEQVFQLACWCKDHQQATRYRNLLLQVVKIDPEHAAARAALGQHKVAGKWVAMSVASDQPTVAGAPNAAQPGPGLAGSKHGMLPRAADVDWQPTMPVDPDPTATFIDPYIAKLPAVANDSAAMEAAIATILLAENRPTAIPRLCQALRQDGFTDLYGASEVLLGLISRDDRTAAKALFPFIVLASNRCTDHDDLMEFTLAASAMHDKRVIPRLIELMLNDDQDLAQTATKCAAGITGLPSSGLTIDQASAWWTRFAKTDDREILRLQMASKQPEIALVAAEQLSLLQDKNAVDTLMALMRSDDPKIAGKAHELITTITGRDWAFTATDPAPIRQQRLKLMFGWWHENREDFAFHLDEHQAKESAQLNDALTPGTGALATGPIADLGSTDPKASATAASQLTAQGLEGAPSLVDGLASPNPIIARRCHEILIRIAGKKVADFDPRAPQATKDAAMAAWSAWLAGAIPAAHPRPDHDLTLERAPKGDTDPSEAGKPKE